MRTYKLFRVRENKLYPLYVEADREMEIGKWLRAGTGEKVDETHVKAKGCGGTLSLRPGYHSTNIPFTDWIGQKMEDGTLAQRADTVWCECEVKGDEIECNNRYGYRDLQKGKWYYFKTNSKQKDPWIISDYLKINKILTNDEVAEICRSKGIEPQKLAERRENDIKY